jgi:hypothetical protein
MWLASALEQKLLGLDAAMNENGLACRKTALAISLLAKTDTWFLLYLRPQAALER